MHRVALLRRGIALEGVTVGYNALEGIAFGHTHKPWHRVVEGIHFVNKTQAHDSVAHSPMGGGAAARQGVRTPCTCIRATRNSVAKLVETRQTSR
jgi:hypothetical protein